MSLSDAETYEKYADELVRFATGLVGPDEAADVVAETFVRVMSRSGSRPDGIRAYLYRSVLNEVRMRHRSTMRRLAREARTAAPEAVMMPEVRPDVLEAVGRLSPRQRAALILTYWDDLDPEAIGARLGISAGSVKRHLVRGRARLREVLDE